MGRIHKHDLAKLPETKKFDLLDKMRDKLRDLIKQGHFDGNPDEWWPAVAIVELAYHPDTHGMLKFACLKTAADLVHIPRTAQAKIESGIPETNITVVVQPWAAAKPVQLNSDRAAIEVTPTRTTDSEPRTD